jgi:hypothetical protein
MAGPLKLLKKELKSARCDVADYQIDLEHCSRNIDLKLKNLILYKSALFYLRWISWSFFFVAILFYV